MRQYGIHENNMEFMGIIKSIIHKVNKVSIFCSSIVIEDFGTFFFFKNNAKTNKVQ